MKHKFQAVGLPGCVTCHGNHDIVHPTDAMLGMGAEAVCARCHASGKFGATIAGAQTAKRLRDDIDKLRTGIDKAQETLENAERLGMEVSQPKFALRSSFDALTNARSLIHAFQPKPVDTALAAGRRSSPTRRRRPTRPCRSTPRGASGWPPRWRRSCW